MWLPPSYRNGFAPRDGVPEHPDLWHGVVGAWCPSLGPTGLTLRDWSGQKNNGTLTNMELATDWSLDRGQYALDFNGVDKYVITYRDSYTLDNFSVSFWIKAASVANSDKWFGAVATGTAGIMTAYRTATSQWAVQLRYDNGTIDTVTLNTSLFDGSWYHVVIVRDGPIVTVYVDGVSVKTGSAPSGVSLTTEYALVLGAINARGVINQHAQITLDDFTLRNVALSAHSVTRLYELGRAAIYRMHRPQRRYTVPSAAAFQSSWAFRSNLLLSSGGQW